MLFLSAALPARAVPAVTEHIDWPAFMARHDLLWRQLPQKWEAGAYHGNGWMGAMIYAKNKGATLNWEQGRSDVNFMKSRIPVGDLQLAPAGKITGFEARTDLWNAEVAGKITTDRGAIEFRSFTHSVDMVNVIEVRTTGSEKPAWTWVPGLASNPRKVFKKETLGPGDQNDPPVTSREDGLDISFQPLKPAGGHAVAWTVVELAPGHSLVLSSVGYAKDAAAARAEAAAAVKKSLTAGLPALVKTHQAWWHAFWPESFVSIPDTRLESFYWIQMYKMASATRPGRPALDLMGPWFRTTPWAMIWWNPHHPARLLAAAHGQPAGTGAVPLRTDRRRRGGAGGQRGRVQRGFRRVGRTSGYDCVGGVGAELCNLPWTMHNYWLQYRYSMDDAMLRDRLFPMLKRSMNLYLHLLKEGPDGKLHITKGMSPEYEDQPGPNPDCNIDLSLLRWGCQTLLAICERLKMDDPQIAQWKTTLERLTPYPRNENGLMISASVPFAHSHRHYSHLVMIYPLYIMTLEQPENRELVIQSLKHWMGMPERLAGYSYTGAASISALLGEGDEAARYLNKLLDTKIPPNTLYVEAGPCIETPLSAAASVNDMLLSSWGDRIRVFPGVPDAWKDVSFHNLRTEGAFLVSAVRKGGATQWVRIQSLAGEPCRIRPGFKGEVRATVPMKSAGDGAYDLTLAKGQEAVLYTGATVPVCEVAPVAADPARSNFYGLPKAK
ncbi:MAG: alpha-L-fucosidase [Kiritimatiellia bacterium]